MADDPQLAQAIASVRRFNRWYTRRVGALQDAVLRSAFSLAEARVLYELGSTRDEDAPRSASDVARTLALDPGYLSRIVRRFHEQGLVDPQASGRDARVQLLRLTARGRKSFATLDKRARDEVGEWLRPLPPAHRAELARTLQRAAQLLDPTHTAPAAPGPPFVLRAHRPGDIGWVVERHGALYAGEYGWDQRFEALVARVAADFVDRFDPAADRCWIAERDGERVGSVFVVRKSKTVAQLRLLLVEPHARGLGLGKALVDESIAFAKRSGYRRMVLWTNSVLDAARHIYRRAGFEMNGQEPHHSFGHDLIGETWSLRW